MKKTLTVEFMVERYDHYNSDLPYKIVESYNDYDIYQVKTDNPFNDIRVISASGTEYVPDQLLEWSDVIFYVNIWTPLVEMTK